MHEYQDADRHITSSGSAVRTGDGRAGAAIEVSDGQGNRVVAGYCFDKEQGGYSLYKATVCCDGLASLGHLGQGLGLRLDYGQ